MEESGGAESCGGGGGGTNMYYLGVGVADAKESGGELWCWRKRRWRRSSAAQSADPKYISERSIRILMEIGVGGGEVWGQKKGNYDRSGAKKKRWWGSDNDGGRYLTLLGKRAVEKFVVGGSG